MRAAWCLGGILAWVGAAGLVDLWWQAGRGGRSISAIIFLALCGAAGWALRNILRQRVTPEGAAALVEQSFPELDNHLINYFQFAQRPDGDPFKTAYVEQGEPTWRSLDLAHMKDRKAHRRSAIAFSVGLAAVLVPGLFVGTAWGVAVWRMVNPFSAAEPVRLTQIVSVQPGSAAVLQGDPLVLNCTVKGFPGHEVRVDVEPDDADKQTFVLGRLEADGEEPFSRKVLRVTTGLRYRFRAGDSLPTRWHTITTRPPPAFTLIEMTVRPPGYTGQAVEALDALSGRFRVPEGSNVDLVMRCNTSLRSASIRRGESEPVAMSPNGEDDSWKGTLNVHVASSLTLAAEDVYGGEMVEEVSYVLEPDRPPRVRILSPTGRALLPQGERPQIGFAVEDDYGIARIELEALGSGEPGEPEGVVVATWHPGDATAFNQMWSSETALRDGREAAFRIVARDNRPPEENVAVSATVTFLSTGAADHTTRRDQLEQAATAGVQLLIELQEQNVSATRQYREALTSTVATQWEEAAERQRRIRRHTKELLQSPIRPLGALRSVVGKLYVNEMTHAVVLLAALPGADPADLDVRSGSALSVQEKILRQLTYADNAVADSRIERRLSGLSAMLLAMIREQGTALKRTREVAGTGAEVGASLVDAQDALAEDLTAFAAACEGESEEIGSNDKEFAAALTAMARRCEEEKIRNDMVLAAERLDEDLADEAVPHEESSLRKLKSLRGQFDQAKLQKDETEKEAMLEVLGRTKEKLIRIKELHERMLASMDAVRGQKDKSDGDATLEMLEEAYEELTRNTQDALLKIPTDLHTFAELNVANDLVEDVYSVFEEIEQVAGSKDGTAEDAEHLDFAKEDVNLEFMDKAVERISEMETWLQDKPDDQRVTTEAFDREEMPEDGVAMGPLGDEVQDLISDLLDEPEDLDQATDDSASTHGVTDFETGWAVEEGDIVTFSAKGKSGNQTPDHKEQDGRSNVGRQGMSAGETAAASGTISQGDENIEARRTEDPTQSGQIDLSGEADTRATGGGKQGTGKADDYGMSGGVKRMDALEEGSWEGMAALMAKQIDSVYAKASMKNVRVNSLRNAAHHVRQSGDAIARGDISQMREHRKLAAASLQRAQAELSAGPTGAVPEEGTSAILDDVMDAGADQAPPGYQEQVAEYFKALNEAL